jgi:hypothetical protein
MIRRIKDTLRWSAGERAILDGCEMGTASKFEEVALRMSDR